MSLPDIGFGSKTNHDQLGGATYPRYMVMYAERKETSDSTPNDEDPAFGFRGATTHTTGTDAKVYMGILNGVLPTPEHNITVSNLSAGIVGETDRVTVKPGIILNPVAQGSAPAVAGSLIYNTSTGELNYHDSSGWNIVSAGGLSAHVLDGAYHTATGLTVGWVVSADSATTFSWKAPTGGMIAHDLTGAYHTEDATGGSGNVIVADSGTTFSWQQLDYTELANIPSTFDPIAHDLTSAYHTDSGLTGGHFLKATGTTTFAFAAHGLGASDVGAYTTAEVDSAIDTDISTHAGLPNEHHAQSHTLAGSDHTATGLTVGWVIAADSSTTFSWQAPSGGVSGTQWTLPVFDTTTSIGDSMVSQDSGGSLLTVSGAVQSVTNLSMTDELDITGSGASIDLNPSGTGTQTIIGIVPSAALVASAEWSGIVIDGEALDPTGVDAEVVGMHINLYGVTLTNSPLLEGLRITMPATYGGGSEYGLYVAGDGRSAFFCSDSWAGYFSGDVRFTAGDTIISELYIGGDTTSPKLANNNDALELWSGSTPTLAVTIGTSQNVTLAAIAAGVTDYDKFLVSDTGEIKFRTGTELASDIGAATVPLALTDLASYAQGSIIKGGSADWEALVLGTETYVLKAGATEPAWGTVDWSELSGTQPAPVAHNLIDTTGHPVSGLTGGHFLKALTTTTYGFAAHGLTEGGDGTDGTAIHDNVANEITAITPKTTLVSADELVLEDSAAAFVKKAVTFGNLESSISKTLAQVLTAGSETDGANIEIDSGGDLIIYSDDGVTEVGRIDGATGHIGVGKTADATYAVDVYSATSSAQINVDSLNTDAILSLRGGTGRDGIIAFYEIDAAKASVTYDAGANQLILRNLTATETIIMNDAGGISISGATTLSSIAAATSDLDKFLVSDSGEIKFRTGTEVASDIGAATVPLALTDLASYVQGSIIIGGGVDWEALGAGTEDYVLKMGAAEPAWGTVDWSELSGTQPAPVVHNLIDTTGHPVSGLTNGHFLKATGTTTYAFEAHGLTASDVGASPAFTKTQWTLPVFDTTTTLGDSMISQNSGGTLATVDGDLKSDKIGIGKSPTYAIDIQGVDAADVSLNDERFVNSQYGIAWYMRKSRGTVGTPIVVDENDVIYELIGYGHDGTNFEAAAKIEFKVGGAPGDNDMPGKIVLSTTKDGEVTPTTALTIDASQNATIAGDLTAANIVTAGNVDGVDVGDFKTAYDAHDGGDVETYHTNYYTDTDVEGVITAEIVDGQSIDNAIDALISTHNVADNHIAHSGVTITAGTGLSGGGTIAADRTINCDITQYTNALAVAAVAAQDPLTLTNDLSVMGGNLGIGIAADAGYLIESVDGNYLSRLGRTQIGHATYTNYAAFCYRGMSGAGQYALIQNSLGLTSLNSASGQPVDFRINHVIEMNLTASGLQMQSAGARVDEFSTDVNLAGNSDTALVTEKAVKTYVDAATGGPGSGTQWTLPVWDTTTTLGDSMVSQNSGGTLATVGGALTVSGALKAGGDGFDVDASGNITDVTLAAATVDTNKFVVQDGSQLKYRTGAQVLSDIGAGGTQKVGPSCPPFLQNGAIWNVFATTPIIVMPASDNDCLLRTTFRVPDEWPTGACDIKIMYSMPATGTYSVSVSVGATSVGDNTTASGKNVLDESTAHDFPTGNANTTYVKTIALSDADITPGCTLGLKILSDALNTPALYIMEMWIEP